MTGDSRREIKLQVNDKAYTADVDVRTTLADCLRRDLKLTGTHLGCEHGVCGACTVLLDGLSVRACLMLAVQADGRSVSTVEGLADKDGQLNVLQQAFKDHHGLQCGFCTPGILMTLTECFADKPDLNEQDIRVALSGNICRCTGYQGVVAAAMTALQKMRSAS